VTKKINEIVNGKRGISPEFALGLEEAIGASAEMWVRMQAEYDLWTRGTPFQWAGRMLLKIYMMP
jgi:addiction module HigA family antidote